MHPAKTPTEAMSRDDSIAGQGRLWMADMAVRSSDGVAEGAIINLQPLRASRTTPRTGDVFCMLPPDGAYLFGRVIVTDATAGGGTPTAQLVCVFRRRSMVNEVPDRGDLRPDDLLISPVMTNRLPRSRGYFETIAHLPLRPGEVLDQHCFLDPVWGHYVNERGTPLPGPIEPVGDNVLHSFRTIDDQVSDALGIPRAP